MILKQLEIIKNILKEEPEVDISEVLLQDSTYNLTILCFLNEKYITNEHLDLILNNESIKTKFHIKLNNEKTILGHYSNLAILLSKYPKLINKLSTKIIDEIKESDWSLILKEQPELLKYCKILDKLEANDWCNIFEKQPQLTIKYKKLYNDINFVLLYDLINNSKSNEILKYIDINKVAKHQINGYNLNPYNLLNIIKVCPEILKSLDKSLIDKINIEGWLFIFKSKPEAINFCPISNQINKNLYNEYKITVIKLVAEQPQFKYLLPSEDFIENNKLVYLIKNQPQLIEELNINLKRLDKEDWIEILKFQPQLINQCNKLHDITTNRWVDILSKQPKLIDYCNKIELFNEDNWNKLLKAQPELLNRCYIDLNRDTKCLLLEQNPNLIENIDINNLRNYDFHKICYKAKEYHEKVLDKYIKYFNNNEFLTNMIGIYPNLKEFYIKNDLWKYVDFNKLTDNLEYSILR